MACHRVGSVNYVGALFVDRKRERLVPPLFRMRRNSHQLAKIM